MRQGASTFGTSEECVFHEYSLPRSHLRRTPQAERQWGRVREDYNQDGNAWDCFTHEMAQSPAYHWGEDGLAGISDDKELLCFSVAPVE